ncbi:Crp/Fnr family transcriptional regulator [Pedobacter sp. JY14-1]|uniref:Crp/Fnr family transcriptional regulator n=1 Tax=Pedobacter sp. JY14-1 TaxID=3034151 RepID=UPI0023E220F1|nr:Crp/Fnr family transcriptional regulator [Pedobacter sp. JY14-1]
MKRHPGCDMRSCMMCRLALDEWKPAINAYRKNFVARKNEVIIEEGSLVTGIYFVYSGKVKVHKRWGDKELIVRFADAGKIFGHRGLGSAPVVYPISATALEETELCFVPLDFFITTLKVNHDLAFSLMMFYADELQESEKKMRNLALMSVRNRLAVALFHLRDQFGTDTQDYIDIDLSRQDLAAFAGATYETVFRTMNEMVNENLVTLSGKRIGIASTERLLHLTKE